MALSRMSYLHPDVTFSSGAQLNLKRKSTPPTAAPLRRNAPALPPSHCSKGKGLNGFLIHPKRGGGGCGYVGVLGLLPELTGPSKISARTGSFVISCIRRFHSASPVGQRSRAWSGPVVMR